MLGKAFTGLKRKSGALILVLLVLTVLASAASVAPVAKADAPLTITPDEGPPGQMVTVTASGFIPGGSVYIVFGGTETMTSATADNSGNLNVKAEIPGDASLGASSISAQDNAVPPYTATGLFTVTSGAASSSSTTTTTPAPTQQPSAAPTPTPWVTYQPTLAPTASGSGIGSSLLIGIIAVVVVACAIPAALLYRGRGKRKTLLDEERPRYGPEPAPAPSRPEVGPAFNQAPSPSYRQESSSSSVYARFNQPSSGARSSSYSRYGQSSTSSPRSTPSSYRGSSVYSKTCPNCRRSVRSDQTMCPFCGKRIF